MQLNVFTSDFGKLAVPLHLGKDKYSFVIFGKMYTQLGKIRPFFGLGMPPVTGGKTETSMKRLCAKKHQLGL